MFHTLPTLCPRCDLYTPTTAHFTHLPSAYAIHTTTPHCPIPASFPPIIKYCISCAPGGVTRLKNGMALSAYLREAGDEEYVALVLGRIELEREREREKKKETERSQAASRSGKGSENGSGNENGNTNPNDHASRNTEPNPNPHESSKHPALTTRVLSRASSLKHNLKLLTHPTSTSRKLQKSPSVTSKHQSSAKRRSVVLLEKELERVAKGESSRERKKREKKETKTRRKFEREMEVLVTVGKRRLGRESERARRYEEAWRRYVEEGRRRRSGRGSVSGSGSKSESGEEGRRAKGRRRVWSWLKPVGGEEDEVG